MAKNSPTRGSTTDVRILEPDDAGILANVAEGVFDHAVDPALAIQFLTDPRHHIAVAIDAGQVVGFASELHYVHPDKPAELWVNELGVAPGHRRLGLAKRLLTAQLEHGTRLGCREAWVLTERTNGPAMRLYAAMGGEEAEEDAVMFSFELST